MSEENKKNIEQKANQTVDKKNILSIEFNRNSLNGLTIFLQSNINWELFSTRDGRTTTIGKIKCFYPKVNKLDGAKSYFIAENIFEYENLPNLNMLLAEKINDGVTFEFGAVPISEEKISNWLQQFKKDVKIIFLQHCKPISIRVNITTETVEKEQHD